MKSRLFIFFFIITLSLFLTNGCSTAEDAQYTLTVTVASGVTGTPATGNYTHTENDVVNYSYTLQAGYENLVVTLDGVALGSSGVITMNTNHTLNVTAEEIFDVTGDWSGTWYWGSTDNNLNCTFSGGYYSGNVNGNMVNGPGNGNGSYSISGDSIEFELNYGSGTVYFTGTIDDNNHMSGTWIAQPGSANGDWELER